MYQIKDLGTKFNFYETQTEINISTITFTSHSDKRINIKSLNQAIYNISIGMEITSTIDEFSIKLNSILYKLKNLILYTLSNMGKVQKSSLSDKIELNLNEFDQISNCCKYKGYKLLNGALSASEKENKHICILAGTDSFINLNEILNIPPINTKVLNLEVVRDQVFQNTINNIRSIENACNTIKKLQQRSSDLKSDLQNLKLQLTTAIENHHAAEKAPNSYKLINDFLLSTSSFAIEKDHFF